MYPHSCNAESWNIHPILVIGAFRYQPLSPHTTQHLKSSKPGKILKEWENNRNRAALRRDVYALVLRKADQVYDRSKTTYVAEKYSI